MTDADLDRQVSEIRQEMPYSGELMRRGALRSQGLSVPRKRVRESTRRVDPTNTALRWADQTSRRPYVVKGPSALCNINGHHKLVR